MTYIDYKNALTLHKLETVFVIGDDASPKYQRWWFTVTGKRFIT